VDAYTIIIKNDEGNYFNYCEHISLAFPDNEVVKAAMARRIKNEK
jgi:hypothetical protein